VAIARAILNNPALVLADEPTGNLDTHTGQGVFQLLRAFNQTQGTTFVLVTHNESLAAQADRILRMVDGQLEPVEIVIE
jgi:lipoprotein-releasing system ATP-binding protein